MTDRQINMKRLLFSRITKRQLIIAVVLLVGTAARFYVARYGHNYDLESYKIVAGITDHGGNVYQETSRYNYGPIWFNLLHLFSAIAHHFHHYWLVFRIEIIGLLTAADIGISYILLRRFGLLAATLFFLNPLSIAITGYHNQFDNLAILLALCAAILLERAELRKNDAASLGGGVLLLGVSLMTKHLFFVFPLWLAWRQKGLWRKAIVLTVPFLLFLISFLPYWHAGHAGIIQNVFRYNSFNNAPFYYFVLPGFVQYVLTPKIFFIGSLLLMGYWTRHQPLFRAALWYLVGLVMFSSAIANQYLVIVMPALAAFASWLFVPYVFFGTVLLWITSLDGIHSIKLLDVTPQFLKNMLSEGRGLGRQYDWVIAFLFLGVSCYVWKKPFQTALARTYQTLRGELLQQLAGLRRS